MGSEGIALRPGAFVATRRRVATLLGMGGVGARMAMSATSSWPTPSGASGGTLIFAAVVVYAGELPLGPA